MPGNGPRVGAAHVEVNAQFNDRSIDEVGKRIHRQLTQVRNRNRKIYQAMGRDAVVAWRAALGATMASAPLIGSAISGLSGATTLLAGSVKSTAQSTLGLVGVLGAVGVAAGTARIAFEGFGDAVSESDPKLLAAALKNLSPEARSSALAVRSLKDEVRELRLSVQNRVFAGLASEISELSGTLFPVMRRGLNQMGTAVNGLFKSLLRYTNSRAGLTQISGVLSNSAGIFKRLSGAAVPFLDGVLRLFNALAPAARRLADRITEIAQKFQEWTSAADFGQRINAGMARAEKTAGLLLKVLGNLGMAINNIFNIANPATNTFLEMLVGVTQRFEDWTNSVGGRNAIAEWAANSVEVMRQFGKTIASVFNVVAELADPRVIISFLTTVENAFNILADLPLDKIVTAFVSLAEALQPISGHILAVIVAGASFHILLGNLIGQVAGFGAALLGLGTKGKNAGAALKAFDGVGKRRAEVSKFTATLNSLKTALAAKVFGPGGGKRIAEVGRHAAELGKHRASAGKFITILKGLGSVLSKAFRIAGIAGMVVWIGVLIAKSKDLQAKVGKAFDALKDVFKELGTAFSEIGEALKPVGKGLEPVFKIMDKLMSLAIGVFLDTVIFGFKSLANVIQGAGRIIAGLINILVGLFTLDFGRMFDGLKQLASGIGPLLKGLFGLFLTFFAPAKFLKLGAGLIRGLARPIVSGLGKIGGFIRTIFSGIGRFFGRIWSSIIKTFQRALNAVAAFVGRGLNKVRTVASNIMGRVRAVIGKVWDGIKGRISGVIDGIKGTVSRGFNALRGITSKAWERVRSAVSTGVTVVLGLVRGFPRRVLSALGNLGKTLYNAGKSLINGFGDGIRAAFDKVKNAAKSGLKKIRNLFPFSPAKEGPFSGRGYTLYAGKKLMLDFGKGMVSSTAQVRSNLKRVMSVLAKGGEQGAVRIVKRFDNRIIKISNSLETVNKKLAKAQALLDSRKQIAQQFRDQVRDGLIQSVFGDANSFSGVLQALTKQRDEMKRFAAAIARLRALGLNKTSMEQIAVGGLDALAAAEALAAQGAEGIRQVNQLQAQINQSAGQAATTASDALYQSGIKAAQGIVDGLKARREAIKKQLNFVGRALGLAIAKAVNSTVGGLSAHARIARNARGTNNFPGGWSWVGEQGPELMRLPRGTQIKSNRDSREMVRPNVEAPVTVNQNFYGPTTSGGRLREIDWTLRYATRARAEAVAGVAR